MQQDGHGCATALPQAQENRARNRRLGLAVKNSWKRLILPGWRWQGGDGALPGWCRSDERLDFKGKEPDPANNPRLFPVWPSRPRSRGFCSLTRSRERRSPAAASRECRCQPHPNLLQHSSILPRQLQARPFWDPFSPGAALLLLSVDKRSLLGF